MSDPRYRFGPIWKQEAYVPRLMNATERVSEGG